MQTSRIVGFLAPAVLWWCFGEHAALADSAAPPAKDSERGARLVFAGAEPIKQEFQVRDDQVEVMNLKVWFRNDGRAPAHLHSVAALQVLTEKRLTPAEEENYFLSAREGSSVKAEGLVAPGQKTSVTSQAGVDEQGWSDFLGKRKYLYSFVSVEYGRADSGSKDDTETESCVWFEGGNLNAVNPCKTDRNKVIESGG
jgi:hypothetical protein